MALSLCCVVLGSLRCVLCCVVCVVGSPIYQYDRAATLFTCPYLALDAPTDWLCPIRSISSACSLGFPLGFTRPSHMGTINLVGTVCSTPSGSKLWPFIAAR